MANSAISRLVFPIDNALKVAYDTPENDGLFSGDNLVIPVLPENYTPRTEGKDNLIERGVKITGQVGTVFTRKAILYYGFDVEFQEVREAVWHVLQELIDSAPSITVLDYVAVPFLYRARGYAIREGLATILPSSGSYNFGNRQYLGYKFTFDQTAVS